MPYDRFLIAPFSEGLVTALRPWLIPDQAFADLHNAYVWRGRVRKRFGGKLMGYGADGSLTAPLLSRFRYQVGVTAGGGAGPGVVPNFPFNIGSQFSIGDIIFTVASSGVGAQQMLRTDGSAAVATFNRATGAVIIAGAAVPDGTAVYFYPALPVMGLCNYEVGAINNQPTIGFDTKWAYEFGTSWDRIGNVEDMYWQGGNLNFFWTCNWQGTQDNTVVMFITNFQVTNRNGLEVVTDDHLVYYGTTLLPTFNIWQPAVNTLVPATTIFTARIIVAFKDRLLLFNTIEQTATAPTPTNTWFKNRCRYSHNGSPLAANAFIQVNNTGFDGGGYLDASTDEEIISAEFIKDRLIVYFERSTWELAYTGNQVLPFTWQKINTELGAESTFSVVPFDKSILCIGNTGVHACSGSNVERIDTKIPDKIFQIVDKDEGVSRVVGIRDYATEMVYWTFPSIVDGTNPPYPNQVLVYNYVTNSWAFNDDCITMFGNYEQQQDVTWAEETMQWQRNNELWVGGVEQAQFRQVIAGNQQGYTFIVAPDLPYNAPVMSITSMTIVGTLLRLTIIANTLTVEDFIYLDNCTGITGLDGNIFQIQQVPAGDPDHVFIAPPATFAGVYLGGGNVTRVSQIVIETKQYNPYIDKGRDVYVAKIDFGVMATENGEVTIDYTPSTASLSMIEDGTATGAMLGTSVLETYPYPNVPIEQTADRLWHPLYFQTEGECIQFSIYLSTEQMLDPDIAFSDFWLEGMVLHTMATTSRLQ